MTTWREFTESLAASQRDAPPFRTANLATGREPEVALGSPGSSESQAFFSIGADRLDFLPCRLRFGSSSWPVPPTPALHDVPLAIHLGDLYDPPVNGALQNAGASRVAASTSSEPSSAQTSATRAPQLRAAVQAWLLANPDQGDCWKAASRDLARCSEAATPGDWLPILDILVGSEGLGLSPQEPSPDGIPRHNCGKPAVTCASASVGDALCRLIAFCSRLGDCVLNHALPFLLASTWCEKAGRSVSAGAGSTHGLNPTLVKVLSQVRSSTRCSAFHWEVVCVPSCDGCPTFARVSCSVCFSP